MKTIHTPNAPAAIGPYSQAALAGSLLFTSGQIPLDPTTGAMVEGDIQAKTHQVFKNLAAILEEAGTDFAHVVKTTVYLADMQDFTAMNQVYAQYFGEDCPARSALQVACLPKNASIEIEMIAQVNP